jgi:GNAT superfamily N-acetyltransferase
VSVANGNRRRLARKQALNLATEVVDIRHFGAGDFAALLEAESIAWAKSLRWDYTPSARLIAACLADKRLSGYALVSDQRIQGYSFFLYEDQKGLIGNLFVEPNGSFKEHALILLDHVIETLKATPGLRRVEAQLPHFGLQDLESCFERHQFVAYLRRFMALRLKRRPRSSMLLAESPHATSRSSSTALGNFIIERWERKHDEAAAQLLYHAYRGHIDGEINDQYRSLQGSLRLIENIVHLRGCGENVPQASLVAVHRPTGKLAGILALTAVRPTTAHIPQIAVSREFQRAGLGIGLMEASFRELERLGFEEVSLTVTDLNANAVRFYKRLGFETFRTFGAFAWNRPAL